MGLIGTQIGNSDNTTTAQIRAAVLTTTITNGDTTHAPDGNAVYDALQLKGDSQTAATQVARLALTGLTRGARVYQTDNGFWYELTNAAAPSDAASWQAEPKVYKATLTQTSTNAPVATVMENSLSAAVVWTRSGVGAYVGTLASAFTVDKTFVSNNGEYLYIAHPAGDNKLAKIQRADANSIDVATTDGVTEAGEDGLLSNYPVSILVYPA